jgi:hypothetical protein
LHTPQIKAGPDKVDRKAMPKGIEWMSTSIIFPYFFTIMCHLTPFNVKDVLIVGDISHRNVLGEQFKGFIM